MPSSSFASISATGFELSGSLISVVVPLPIALTLFFPAVIGVRILSRRKRRKLREESPRASNQFGIERQAEKGVYSSYTPSRVSLMTNY